MRDAAKAIGGPGRRPRGCLDPATILPIGQLVTSPRPLLVHPDRLLPTEPAIRSLARELYASVAELPIISPHGHTDPSWFANDEPFGDAAELLLAPDHYLFRMLYSQGISLEQVGIYPLVARSTRAKPGGSWQPTFIFSAALRRAYGSTGFSPRCSG